MNPKRPYFIRAMHEWLTDNDYTPYLMIDITQKNVIAPTEYAQDGRLVLSVSWQSTKDLHMDNHALSFAARFAGISKDLYIPMRAVMSIYAKEDPEQGLFFDPSEYDDISDDTNIAPTQHQPNTSPSSTPKDNPRFKIIK